MSLPAKQADSDADLICWSTTVDAVRSHWADLLISDTVPFKLYFDIIYWLEPQCMNTFHHRCNQITINVYICSLNSHLSHSHHLLAVNVNVADYNMTNDWLLITGIFSLNGDSAVMYSSLKVSNAREQRDSCITVHSCRFRKMEATNLNLSWLQIYDVIAVSVLIHR